MDAIGAYLEELPLANGSISRAAVRHIVDALETIWASDGTTFLIGNGGSASTASHMVTDLNNFTMVPRQWRFRAISLTDNGPLITDLANDLEYTDTFVEPLRHLARSGGAAIAISGSGDSPTFFARSSTHCATKL